VSFVVKCFPDLAEALDSCDDLSVKSLIAILTLLLFVPALAKDCPKDQPKTEAALLQLDQNWADALSHKDADTVACMVADEFEDADVDGSLHTRSQMLAHIPERRPGSNHLTEMRAHVEGSFGFVRGLNQVLDPAGKLVARVRFTDIFTYRDGRWQALAGHETLVGEASR
jgi:ketosteroid isomerase-like protein